MLIERLQERIRETGDPVLKESLSELIRLHRQILELESEVKRSKGEIEDLYALIEGHDDL